MVILNLSFWASIGSGRTTKIAKTKEEIREYHREYYQKNKERLRPLYNEYRRGRKDHRNSLERKAYYEKYRYQEPIKSRLTGFRQRAKRDNVPFDLDVEYLKSIWTGFCSISGSPIDFSYSKVTDQTASLDRIIPEKGYTKGNVAWVSQKFNKLKSNGTTEDFELILKYLKENYDKR